MALLIERSNPVIVAWFLIAVAFLGPAAVAALGARGPGRPWGWAGRAGALVGTGIAVWFLWLQASWEGRSIFDALIVVFLVGSFEAVALLWFVVVRRGGVMRRLLGGFVLGASAGNYLQVAVGAYGARKLELVSAHLAVICKRLDESPVSRGGSLSGSEGIVDAFAVPRYYAEKWPQCRVIFPPRGESQVEVRVYVGALDESEWIWTRGSGWRRGISGDYGWWGGPDAALRRVVESCGELPDLPVDATVLDRRIGWFAAR